MQQRPQARFLHGLFCIVLAWLARPLLRRDNGQRERVLVVKPDHLGDLLLASPALKLLRERFPQAHIVGLVGPWSRRIWQGNPELDALLELPFPGFTRGPTEQHTSPLERVGALLRPYLLLLRYALLLRTGRYDAALLLRDDHWWGAALVALAGIPVRIGHSHPLSAHFLSHALPFDPREHVARQALAVVEAVSFTGSSAPALTSSPAPPTSFYPTPAEQTWAAAWIAAQLAPDERLVVLHPGTGGPTKHWLSARWAIVGDGLLAVPGVRLLLTGGPGEEALVSEISRLMARPPLTLAGRTSVGQLTALLGRAVLVLGVDSGPLHLAVSQGTPTVHLFGPSDHLRFGPWGEPTRHRVLRANLFCSPCGLFAACPRGTAGPECMAAITAEDVIAAAQTLLARTAER